MHYKEASDHLLSRDIRPGVRRVYDVAGFMIGLLAVPVAALALLRLSITAWAVVVGFTLVALIALFSRRSTSSLISRGIRRSVARGVFWGGAAGFVLQLLLVAWFVYLSTAMQELS
jgi:VIT1/CCC1 family predicted Fe2+/Mn2+ transporter